MLKKPKSKRMITKRPQARRTNPDASSASSHSADLKMPQRQGTQSEVLPLTQLPKGDAP
jgi:hypothetical protein